MIIRLIGPDPTVRIPLCVDCLERPWPFERIIDRGEFLAGAAA